MRHGTRVRLVRAYGQHEEPLAGARGTVTYRWPDGMLAIDFDHEAGRFAYHPADLEEESAPETSPSEGAKR